MMTIANAFIFVLLSAFAVNGINVKWNSLDHQTIARTVKVQVRALNGSITDYNLEPQQGGVYTADIDLSAGLHYIRFNINGEWATNGSYASISIESGDYNPIRVSPNREHVEFVNILPDLEDAEATVAASHQQQMDDMLDGKEGITSSKTAYDLQYTTGYILSPNFAAVDCVDEEKTERTSAVDNEPALRWKDCFNYIVNGAPSQFKQPLAEQALGEQMRPQHQLNEPANDQEPAAEVPQGRIAQAGGVIAMYATPFTLALLGLDEAAQEIMDTVFFGDECGTAHQAVGWTFFISNITCMPYIFWRSNRNGFNRLQYLILLLLVAISGLFFFLMECMASDLGADVNTIKGLFVSIQLFVLMASILFTFIINKK